MGKINFNFGSGCCTFSLLSLYLTLKKRNLFSDISISDNKFIGNFNGKIAEILYINLSNPVNESTKFERLILVRLRNMCFKEDY